MTVPHATHAPLAGLRVLDTAMLYAAPLIATLLADHGAEVIKVEPPDGDVYRPDPAMWALVGRRKRSITIDTRTDAGQQLLLRLATKADVVVENLPRAVAERRSLTPEAFRAGKPSLVVVSASGFGPDGPYGNRPANGTVGEAFAGLTGLTGPLDGPPFLPGFPLGDAVAAAFGAMGALAGIVRALRTGEGATIDLTVHEPLLHTLGPTLAGYRPDRPPPVRDAGAMGVPLRGSFQAADGGWVVISASTPRHVAEVSTLAGGVESTPVRDRAAAWIATLPRDAVVDALLRVRVTATPVNDLHEVFDDPHIEHRASLTELGGATIASPTPAMDGPEVPAWLPDLGEGNADVFAGWLGLDAAEIGALRDQGVI